MTRASEGWYVAEPDGTTFGPMTRDEMATQHGRGAYSRDALAWHVDLSEWHPVARMAAPSTHGAHCPPGHPQAPPNAKRPEPEARAAKTGPSNTGSSRADPSRAGSSKAGPSKAERKRMAKEAQRQRDIPDDGKRLLSQAVQGVAAMKAAHAASAAASPASARTEGATPAAEDAERNSRRLGLGFKRLLARLIDWLTLGALGGALLWGAIVYSGAFAGTETQWFTDKPAPELLLVLGALALVPLEALALAIAGTTPGKALLGLRVRRKDGTKPNLAQAVNRSVAVAIRGLAFGIPFFAFFTVFVAFIRLMNNGEATWDRNNQLEVDARQLDAKRWQTAFIVLAVAFFMFVDGTAWQTIALDFVGALAGAG